MSILDAFDPSSPEIISASSIVHPVPNFPKVILTVLGMRTKSWTVEAPKEARVHCSHTKKGFVLCNYTSRHVL
jgi:hypothetical protein